MRDTEAAEWTARDRRIGIWSARAVFVLGILYAPTLIVGLVSAGTLGRPITDPILAILEVQIILMTLPMVVMMAAAHRYAPRSARTYSLAALGFMILAAGTSVMVHFVQLTVVRRLEPFAASGSSDLFSWEWPSVLYALDVVAWDLFFGVSLLLAAPIFTARDDTAPRVGLIVTGTLCIVGLVGPALNIIGLRFIGIVGYTVVFPIVCLLMARTFRRAGSVSDGHTPRRLAQRALSHRMPAGSPT